MGRKRNRAWKYICFCTTILIFLSLFNCAPINKIGKQMEAREYLLQGQKLLAQRNYEGALSEYQRVLSISPGKTQEAEALFKMGLIYAHFGYPKKNYEKSMHSFVKILNDYPESPLVEQAKVWVGVLQEKKGISQGIGKSKQTVTEPEKSRKPEAKIEGQMVVRERLLRGQKLLAQGDYEGAVYENQRVLSMATYRSPRDEALFNMGLIYAHSGNPKKDFEKSIEFFKKLIKDYPESPLVEQSKIWIEVLQKNEELNEVIQKLKQVDIEIEDRKREKAK
jgi:tetratricopeptide (TPR) repeat protein